MVTHLHFRSVTYPIPCGRKARAFKVTLLLYIIIIIIYIYIGGSSSKGATIGKLKISVTVSPIAETVGRVGLRWCH